MASANPSEGLRGPGIIKKASGWFIAMSVIFILLGMAAIVEPGVAGLAVALLVGWLLIFGGIVHIVSAFSHRGTGRAFWQVILAIVYLVGGYYFLKHPLLALGTLTLFLAGILLAEAILEFVAYFRTRKAGGSGWMLFNAIVTLLLGALIWRHWPSSSVWAIGTIVGIKLMMTGISRLMLGMAVRKLASGAAA